MIRPVAVRATLMCVGAFALFAPMSIAGEQVALATLAVALAVALASPPRMALRPLALDAPALLYAAAVAASLVSSPLPFALPAQAFFVRTLAAYFLVSRALLVDVDAAAVERRAAVGVALAALSAALAGALALAQFPTGFDLNAALHLRAPIRIDAPGVPGRYAAIGFFTSRLTLATVLVVPAGLLAGVVALWRGPVARRALAALALALVLVGVALSFGRTAWGGLVLGALAAALLAAKARTRAVLVGCATALALAAALATPVREGVHAALSTGSASARGYLWSRAAEIVSEYPLTGTGAGSYRRALDPLFDAAGEYPGAIRAWCHDTPLTVLAEAGPLALAAWLWLWAAFFAAAARAYRRHPPGSFSRAAALGAVAAGVAVSVISLLHDVVVDSRASYAIFALCGLAAALDASARAAPDSQSPGG